MERKKGVVYLCLIVLLMMVAGSYLSRNYVPGPSAKIRAEVTLEYKKLTGENYESFPLVWFDENGGKRDAGVYRYFGTYGDCVVLLIYHFPIEVSAETPRYPYRISSTRTVMLPAGYEIMVFNRDPNCKTNEVYPFPIRISAIYIAVIKLNWLTDNQAEQIGRDLEDWVAKGNY